MNLIRKLIFGSGQIIKDMSGAMISVYSIAFFEGAIGLTKINVGTMMMIGQLTNAIASPLIGFLIDKLSCSACCLKTQTFKQTYSLNDSPASQIDKQTKETDNSNLAKLVDFEIPISAFDRRKICFLFGNIIMIISITLLFGQPKYFIEFSNLIKLVINTTLIVIAQVS